MLLFEHTLFNATVKRYFFIVGLEQLSINERELAVGLFGSDHQLEICRPSLAPGTIH